jgi:hypothetical protein
MHSLKYHKSDLIGVLIGSKSDNCFKVTDAIPLFHQRVMQGPLEIAFDMIESCYPFPEGTAIIGVYEAPLSTRPTDSLLSPIALSIATQIKATSDPLIISLNTAMKH